MPLDTYGFQYIPRRTTSSPFDEDARIERDRKAWREVRLHMEASLVR